MCGIAGILGARADTVDELRLTRMRDVMAHRGPDGEGLWLDRERSAGLAHRRLAIVDLSPTGAQPMSSEDGRHHLVFNGEIYNHLELRRELEVRGHRFRGRSDTEAILRGFAEWGEGVLERLVGEFAFALYEPGEKRLLLVRDRLGIKPLYFAPNGDELLFASEIKGILADPQLQREMDPLAAWHYLAFRVPPAPLTMFRGIYKLPAGHVLRAERGRRPVLERWWDPAARGPADLDPAVYRDEGAAAAELLRRLDRSIERRMMSDVPFGVFLSGGIDSSTIVALMARHMTQPVETFTVGFARHERVNEFEPARRVARHFGTRHHEVRIDDADAQRYLPELVFEQDEPIADWVSIPLHFVSRLARESGVIVVQVGEGADELLCGYEHFRVPLDLERRYARPLARLPGSLRWALLALTHALGRFSPAWRRRAATAERIAGGAELFLGGAEGLAPGCRAELWPEPPSVAGRALATFVPAGLASLDPDAVVGSVLDPFRRSAATADLYQNMLYLELRYRLPELLLMRVDKVTMATSVEARVPFLDHDLVEFAMGLPQSFRLHNGVGKHLLRRAVRGLLPDEVIDRPKMGFSAPFAEWLSGPLGDFARARFASSRLELVDRRVMIGWVDQHRSGRADRSHEVWIALSLALWYEHWIDPGRI